MSTLPNNIIYLSRQNRWADGDNEYDPDLEFLLAEIHNRGLNSSELIEMILEATQGLEYVGYRTIDNWISRRTRFPMNRTISLVALALGFEREWSRANKNIQDVRLKF